MSEIVNLEPEDEQQYYAVRPNKTQIKKDMADLTATGEEMCLLTQTQLDKLQLPVHIYQSILQAAKMPHKSARKRQLKYIAGQLKKIDLEQVNEQLSRIKNKSAHAVREHHQAEKWRDKLITDAGNTALTEFLSLHSHADSQQLRQLQRNAKKEHAAEKPPKYSRQLYQYLKELLSD